jgi:hypothetical protein
MHCRLLAILAILSFAFGGGGCASKSKQDYEEVLMPLQTGSVLQRRVLVKSEHRTKRKTEPKKKKKPAEPKPAEPKPELEPEPEAKPEGTPRATPTPAEETERFR